MGKKWKHSDKNALGRPSRILRTKAGCRRRDDDGQKPKGILARTVDQTKGYFGNRKGGLLGKKFGSLILLLDILRR
jgi:hypothetical protein